MTARPSSPVISSPLGRGFAQLHALHAEGEGGQRFGGAVPFRHSQFLRVFNRTIADARVSEAGPFSPCGEKGGCANA